MLAQSYERSQYDRSNALSHVVERQDVVVLASIDCPGYNLKQMGSGDVQDFFILA